jgi:putative addiction module component (TIGR02574 family)
MVTLQSLGIDRLPHDELVALSEALEQHIHDTRPHTGLSPEHLADLQRRLDDDDVNPDEGIPWEEVKRRGREIIEDRCPQ